MTEARDIWRAAIPALGTPAERWLAACGIAPAALDLEGMPIRWSAQLGAVVALMTDAATAIPTGLLSQVTLPDGRAKPPTIIGTAGVVRLSRDEEVALGLGLAEDLPTGLARLAGGWRPTWAAGSLGVVTGFPVLGGVEALTLHLALGSRGMAARACASRWRTAGREVTIAEGVRHAA